MALAFVTAPPKPASALNNVLWNILNPLSLWIKFSASISLYALMELTGDNEYMRITSHININMLTC